jgi:taurine---2-oxoglutarate transaminase
MGEVMRGHHEALMARHPSVGAVRNIGLFGIIELVRDRRTMEPLSPFNQTNEEMQAVMRSLLDQGLYTISRWHAIMTNPPLSITDEELAEGFHIIDQALVVSDRAATL